MSALTEVQIALIRDFIGDSEPPDDFDLQEIFDRVASPIGVAYAVLSKRLGEYLSVAASYSIVGVYQESTQANIDNLRQYLKDMEKKYPFLETQGDASAGSNLTVTRIVRVGRGR